PHEHSCSLSYAQWLNQIHPEQRQLVDQQLQQAIATHTDYAVEYRLITPDNSINWVLAKGRGVYDSTGKLLRMLGVIINITERKLAEAEQRRVQVLQGELQLLEDILETAQVGYWEWHLAENQGYFSSTLKRMLGYETHELVDKSHDWQYLLFEEDLPEFLDSFNQHFQNCSDSPYFQELRYRHKDGSAVWAICSGRVIEWDHNGQPLRIIGSNINITQRKQTEEALKQSERRYANLTEAAPVGIFQLDTTGKCTYVNERWTEMTGRPTQAALGMGWIETVHSEDRDRLMREWSLKLEQEIVDRKAFYESEGRYLCLDGTISWFYLQVAPEIDTNDNIIGYIGTLTDISERQQAQTALQESEQRYASLAKAAPVGIFRLDTLGNCVYVNDRWSEMAGRPREAALGMGWIEAIHPEDYERIRQEWFAAGLTPNELFYQEGRHLHPDGKVTWFHSYLLPETSPSGSIIGYIGTLTDITIRKQTEEQLHHLSERLTLALQSGRFGIWEYDFVQDRVIWDDQMYVLYGLSKDDFSCTYEGWLNCLHSEDRAYLLAVIDRVIQGKQEYNVDFRIVQPSGNISFLKGYGILKRDKHGEPIRIIGVNYDITERKQAEQELEESRTMLRLVLDTIPQRVFWKDCQSRFLGCNPAFASDYQLTPNEIIGKTDFELPWAKWAELYRKDDAIVMQTRTPKLGYEEQTENLDGEQLWLRTNKVPLTNSTGEVIGVLVSHEDITERKLAEVQLRQTNEQLAHTNV
ncbi:bifunctional diguanylate cyclase/phosphodiesterase, partial [Nostoc sp. FACHB-110]|uniref:bifunctional diguanylate cyclase/phosphodiesterase n=1 Tax=Nostoc sp. FACHB-110 TaxID=2692834 RepID=UPI0016825198